KTLPGVLWSSNPRARAPRPSVLCEPPTRARAPVHAPGAEGGMALAGRVTRFPSWTRGSNIPCPSSPAAPRPAGNRLRPRPFPSCKQEVRPR
ncbi:hypothetical protein P7K49_015243, partial [Saguinus oedipus]